MDCHCPGCGAPGTQTKTFCVHCREVYGKERPGGPFCPGCECVIDREGAHCQSCRIKFNVEYDECVCYSESPEECQSKLEHYCCCSLVEDTDICKAPDNKHDTA